MARQTRSQRRARREAQQASGVAARAQRRSAQMRPSQQPVASQTGRRRRAPGEGGRRFISESWAELKKVEWPTQAQVIQGTVVVLIACAIVGVYLFAADQTFKPLVKAIIGQ
jgi:preprotein translocase subunit SecE